jgi:hypothetical protein
MEENMTQPNNYLGSVSITSAIGDYTPAGLGTVESIGGTLVRVSVEFTRTTGTTGYDANDAVLPAAGGLVELPLCGRVPGGSGYITELRLATNKKSMTSATRIHFFNASNPTIAADGATWKDLYADAAKRIGYYDMPPFNTAADATNSDMSRSMDITVRLPFVCAAATKSLWFALETLGAFTPADSQKFTLVVICDQN